MRNKNQRYIIFIQIILDIALIYGSLVATFYLRFQSGLFEYIRDYLPFEVYMFPFYFLAPIYILANYLTGQYKVNHKLSYVMDTVDLIKSHSIGVVLFLSILFTQRTIDYSRVFIILFAFVLFTVTLLARYLFTALKQSINKRAKDRYKILLVGFSNVAKEYIKKTNEHNATTYEIIGILDDNTKNNYTYGGVKVIGTYADLESHLQSKTISEVIIAVRLSEFDKINSLVNLCETYGIHTRFIPDYYQYIPSKPYIEDFEGIPLISIRRVPLNDAFNRFIKRTVDIVFSIASLITLSPLFLTIAILVKLTSKGPVMFRQTRVGLYKKEFTILKFRSMTLQLPSQEKKAWTTKGDIRVTALGHFMRKSNIDELPQLFNVLKGDMSIIGPRPERPYFVERFMHTIPKYMIKHQVRPGMSGWAQVHGWRGDTSINERIKHDIYYIENWSLLMDIRIVLMTLFTRKGKRNAY